MGKNSWLVEFKWRIIGTLLKLFIDALFGTTRIETFGFDKVRRLYDHKEGIAAFWHSRILLFSYLFKGWKATILVSASNDGEYVARVIKKQGHEPVRGSTSRGGLRAAGYMIRRLNQGKRGVVIPDGPQGPRFRVQAGVLTLAKKTGLPIVPMAYSAKKIKIFNSWDRFILPYPFTTCRVVYGEPVYVPSDSDKETEEKYRVRLEQELRRITTEADNYFGHTIG